jgi:hypothetical protein
VSIVQVRLRKKLLPKIEQWSAALDITETEFVHEALTHYIRFLSGIPTGSNVVALTVAEAQEEKVNSALLETEMDVEDYDGGIAL